ncbi:hypothetical protein HYH03_013545 [Edaphochlamys debaryana]|uniref:Uncharacterized protein n=1 Tax=Edaphochlamys debaryana TaxID=47281 RepID=A0A836BUC6_9CHLO|nr:hypothetical protein HYH03_013545 [Edaphochlamys debaryana]|eukprot:KAG2487828.1 hypothetical protein HYH03_013545 [Edaphochlamys debaryana]
MSGSKKSVDEIWRELNAAKPKARSGVAGLAVGLGGLPGVTSIVRNKSAAPSTVPTTAPAAASGAPGPPPASAPAAAPSASSSSPAPDAALSEDVAAYLASLQRTLNCLADPDRALRRTAAAALQAKLFTGDAATPPAPREHLRALLAPGPLLRPLLALLADPVERCRATALGILQAATAQLGADVGPALPELVPALAVRCGVLPVQEPAEEVRLQVVELARELLQVAPPDALGRLLSPDLASLLCRGLDDPFPDMKRAAAAGLEAAAARLPPALLAPEAERLLRALAPALQHPHSRVRQAAVAALDALVSGGAGGKGDSEGQGGGASSRAGPGPGMGGAVSLALVEEVVVPALRPVGHDRSQAVRDAAFSALAGWMGARAGAAAGAAADGPGPAGSEARAAAEAGAEAGVAGEGEGPTCAQVTPLLLPLLLLGVTDPQPATAELALRLVEAVGEAWAAGQGQGQQGAAVSSAGDPAGPSPATEAEGDAQSGQASAGAGAGAGQEPDVASRVAAAELGPPYAGRPGAGCRALVAALLPQLLPALLRGLGEWTVGLRLAAARVLHTALALAEGAAEGQLGRLLPALCSAIADEEAEVASLILAAASLLGAHTPPAAWMPPLLERLAPPAPASPATSTSSTSASAPGPLPGLSASQRTQTLVVLAGMLRAGGRAGWPLPPPLLAALAATLAEEGSLAAAAEHPAVRQQLLAVVRAALAWAGPAAAAVAPPLHVVLLQMYGSELAAAPPGAAAAAAVAGSQTGAAVLSAMDRLAAAVAAAPDAAAAAPEAGAPPCDPLRGAELLAEAHADWLLGALFDGAPGTSSPASASASAPVPPPTPSTSAAAADSPAAAPWSWRPRSGDAAWGAVLRAALLTCPPAALRRLAPRLVAALGPAVAGRGGAGGAAEGAEGDDALAAAAGRAAEAGSQLGLLRLLDAVLEDGRRGPALAEGGGKALLQELLLPPLVWRAGKAAAAVRYGALTALATLLGRGLLGAQELAEVVEAGAAAAVASQRGSAAHTPAASPSPSAPPAPPPPLLLPLLASCLDEDWYTDLRLASCYVAEKMMQTCGPLLSDTARRALYPELTKRLDDAHNPVRCAAARALVAFVRGAGGGYCDTNTGYLVGAVALHMDDSDAGVQEAACSVLLAAAALKPRLVGAQVAALRPRFRSKHYCDRVLAAAQEAADAAGAEAGDTEAEERRQAAEARAAEAEAEARG